MNELLEEMIPAMDINWYPGHMEKARREMNEAVSSVDLVIELRDARAPLATSNPLLAGMIKDKPHLLVLTKKDKADPAENARWLSYFEDKQKTLLFDLNRDPFKKELLAAIEELLKEKRERALRRGIRNKTFRALVVGIPNVGKSTFINKLSGKKSLKTENRPGVTKSLAQIRLSEGLALLDTPGVLWPKFSDPQTGVILALIGSINPQIVDAKELARQGVYHLLKEYPGRLHEYYGCEESSSVSTLESIGSVKNWLQKGGEVDMLKTAEQVLYDLREGELRVSWEKADAE
ncbi:MAG: ribosome biogenesis GTPase YlqF [Erysipelotrichaceae bacterium]|nr:ribosome biogenesis GTPase YlqF [Erysipelotrichaceae bacterium]